MKKIIGLCLFFSNLFFCIADGCPQSDLTGDCVVNLWDLAIMASEWLVEGDPNAANITWVYISDSEGFNGQMSKYETTNAQYCQYLNAALSSNDIRVENDWVYGNGGPYIDQVYFITYEADPDSQISYSDGTFSVRSRDSFDMSNHPVVQVSWYGAMSFAQYYGWRLPTQWEWQAVANHEGEFTYGCGTTINCSMANYYSGSPDYCNPLGLSTFPYTTAVDFYPAYGYGLNDMAGNVWEWTDSCYYGGCDPDDRVLRGGGWSSGVSNCTVFGYNYDDPQAAKSNYGFRVCR